jgi:hypothetical protein
MANSCYLTNSVEPYIVDWVARQIGIKLERKKVVVGTNENGSPVSFEFDGVSVDNEIGLLVSSSGTIKPGALRKLIADAAILLNAPFQRRYMAFARKDVYLNFKRRVDGLLPLGKIEMLVCDTLPTEMVKQITAIRTAAQSEVGYKRKRQRRREDVSRTVD